MARFSGRGLRPNEIGQAVRQRAGANRRVERQRRVEVLRALDAATARATQQQQRRHARRSSHGSHPDPSPRYAGAMRLKIRRLDPTVPLPAYGTDESAGFDLAAAHDVSVAPRQIALVRTGSSSKCRPDTSWRFSPEAARRSSADLLVANGVGIVDPDYSGPSDEIMIQVLNISDATPMSAAATASLRASSCQRRGSSGTRSRRFGTTRGVALGARGIARGLDRIRIQDSMRRA